MNAITLIGAPVALGRFGRLRDCPIPGESSIPVTINGTRLLVFHEAGRPTWCHIQLQDGVIIAGIRASDAVAGSLHGMAVQVADALLAGLRQAGEYPKPADARDWVNDIRVAALSIAFAGIAFLLMWATVAVFGLRNWQR